MTIQLDSNIFHWVLAPIMVIMLFVGLLRHYAGLLLKSAPTMDVTQTKDKRPSEYAHLLLRNGFFLSPAGFKERVKMLNDVDAGLPSNPPASNPMAALSDPSMAGTMNKQQMLFNMPNMVMMGVFSTMLGGFVIAKFPFPMAARFKGMTQRGVEIDYLDASYVTSLSLYFIVMTWFGIQGIVDLTVDSGVVVAKGGGCTSPWRRRWSSTWPSRPPCGSTAGGCSGSRRQ
jgi:hypothetical protein